MKYTKHKRVCGVGINDADYVICPKINGKQVSCPFYSTWVNMLRRCYSKTYRTQFHHYIGCSVTEEWHSFMAFRNWMSEQQWCDRQLDKDIIKPNNKVYSPDNCMWVSKTINLLLTDSKAARGRWPQGVCYVAGGKAPYKASLNIKRKSTHLGLYNTPEEAHAAYCLAKADYIESLFPELTDEDPRLIPALQRHADDFRRKAKAKKQKTKTK